MARSSHIHPVVESPPHAMPATAGGKRYPDAVIHSIHVGRKFVQGIAAALLTFAGADSLTSGTGARALERADFSSMDGITTSFLNGQFTAPMQIVGAILIYLAAGQSLARFVGLIVGALFLVLYLQGVSLADALHFLGFLASEIAAAISWLYHALA